MLKSAISFSNLQTFQKKFFLDIWRFEKRIPLSEKITPLTKCITTAIPYLQQETSLFVSKL